MLNKIKEWWWVLGAVGLIAAFSNQFQAIASAPKQIEKTSETVNQLAQSLQQYIALQEEQKKFTEYRLQNLEKK